jgi:DNA modification methylase
MALVRQIHESKIVEEKLVSVLHEIHKKSEKHQKDFSFYWSKKSPFVAASVYKVFAELTDTVLDPFVGSGSALYGLKLFPNKMKFIGVDVNQLPIELIHFNMRSVTEHQISKISEEIECFINLNREIYNYKLLEDEEPFTFKKAHLSRTASGVEPTLLVFERAKTKYIFTSEDGSPFEAAKAEYLKRYRESRQKNSELPDLDLGTNSRIAIKSGMKLSEIFSPITFNLLLQYREKAKVDTNLAILLSTCLHLCRLTDTRSQSQFPFWVPKNDAVDRNIFDLLRNKVDQLRKILKDQDLDLYDESNPARSDSFDQLSKNIESSYLLHHAPIQMLDNSQIPDESIDLVFTDPPYFDQVAYSEYLVIWEFFTGIRSDLENEIIQSNREVHASDRRKYLQLMTEGFNVVSKKLKDGHLAIVYFKDSKLKNISDFLQVMEDANLEYVHQIHVSKPKFTYKQNTSQASTVEGDSLYVFRKVKNLPKRILSQATKDELNEVILSLIDSYLSANGFETPSKVLDNWIIPKLWETNMLHLFTQENSYQALINENYEIDRETRKIIGRLRI